MGGMVVERNRGVIGVRKLEVTNIGTVNLDLELIVVTEDRQTTSVGGDRIGTSGCQVLHGVVEVELLDFGSRRDRLLNLGDQHVLGLRSEHLTLLGIEVRIVRVDIPLFTGIGGVGTPSNPKLDIMILKRNEREGSLPVLTERKPEGVETLIGGATVEVTCNRLGGGGRGEGGSDKG
tara:strand:- start:235 stop:765 length:531 start_codon:yes stop_codon:yes gene_type:complete